MRAFPVIPGAVRAGGHDWTIERIWPPRDDDPRLPLEARAGDRVRGGHADAGGTVTLLAPEGDPALPALAALAREGQVVAHRPARRAVVRLSGGRGYAKAVRRGRGRDVRDAHERGRGFAAGFAVPDITSDSPDVVCFRALPGRSVAALGEDPRVAEAEWAALWRSWEGAWLAAMAGGSPDGLPEWGTRDEGEVIRGWARHASAQFGGEEGILHAAERVVARLSAAGPASALAHRDLHDGQLIWDAGTGIGLIDLDTCARADPGLDLGNLAAHIDFAVRQRRWSPARAQVAMRSVVQTAGDLGVDAERLAAWHLAARFRVACVNALRPRWRRTARAELADIEATTLRLV